LAWASTHAWRGDGVVATERFFETLTRGTDKSERLKKTKTKVTETTLKENRGSQLEGAGGENKTHHKQKRRVGNPVEK